MKLSKLKMICLVLSLGVVTSLSGCSLLSDSQKTALDIYLKKRTVDDIVLQAQTSFNEADYIQASLNYHIDMINKDKSMTDKIVDAASWDLKALKSLGAGQWKGTRTSPNNEMSEKAFCMRDDSTGKYDLYRSNDNEETWVREETSGVWSGLVLTAINFADFQGCEGLVLEKEPVDRDEISQWYIHGTISYDKARSILNNLENKLNLIPNEQLDNAESVSVELYVDTDYKPRTLIMRFNPGATLTKQLIYDKWDIIINYSNYDAYTTFSIPNDIKLKYITQEDNKKRENSFDVGGHEIEIETTAAETEPETNEDGSLKETIDESSDSTE